MWATFDTEAADVKVALTTDAHLQPRIRIQYGELMIRVDVPEAVELVDAVVMALAELDGAVSLSHGSKGKS